MVVFIEGVVDAMLESELVSGEDLKGVLKSCYQLRNSLVVGNPLLVGVHVEVVEYRIMRALVKPGAKEIVDAFVGSLSEKINKK